MAVRSKTKKPRSRLKPDAVEEMFRRWSKANPDPASELEYLNAYTLVVAVVLSAQATDLFRNKAKNVIGLSKALIEEHDSEVPHSREALEELPGVGRKTANVVLNVAFGEPTMAVDTHIFRISNRTGLAPGKNPLEVELGLVAHIPEAYMRHAHHWLILHGRYVCKARKPECPGCLVADLCKFKEKTVAM